MAYIEYWRNFLVSKSLALYNKNPFQERKLRHLTREPITPWIWWCYFKAWKTLINPSKFELNVKIIQIILNCVKYLPVFPLSCLGSLNSSPLDEMVVGWFPEKSSLLELFHFS